MSSLVGAPHPWRRYFARAVDNFIASFVFAFVAIIVFGDWWLEENLLLFYWLVFLLWVPVEATLLAAFGTTPGKAMFGIRLEPPSQAARTFGLMFNRALRVWFLGMGAGIPLVTLFTVIAAYWRLKEQKRTSWDEALGITVVHRGD